MEEDPAPVEDVDDDADTDMSPSPSPTKPIGSWTREDDAVVLTVPFIPDGLSPAVRKRVSPRVSEVHPNAGIRLSLVPSDEQVIEVSHEEAMTIRERCILSECSWALIAFHSTH